MIKLGQALPAFNLKAVVSSSADLNQAFTEIQNTSYPNQWLVLFFWPKDFTFVCPTELAEFGKQCPEFTKRNAQVLGCSVDSEFVHLAWREHHPALKNIPFPMLSDIKRELSNALGVLNEAEGVTERATFIIDPKGIIRFIMLTDMKVGRNVNEIIRVLDALQTDQLCGCNWQSGDDTLS